MGENVIVSPDSIDFGNVAVGEWAKTPVTITNRSLTEGLKIDDIANSCPYIHWRDNFLPVFIDPGESYAKQVYYIPGSTGSHECTLRVDCAVLYHDTSFVFVQGVGTGADPQCCMLSENFVGFGDLYVGGCIPWEDAHTITLSNISDDTIRYSISPPSLDIEYFEYAHTGADTIAAGQSIVISHIYCAEVRGDLEGMYTITCSNPDSTLTDSFVVILAGYGR
jgi:hypothetical protein